MTVRVLYYNTLTVMYVPYPVYKIPYPTNYNTLTVMYVPYPVYKIPYPTNCNTLTVMYDR
jgi:hypothetical protein